MQYSQPRDTLPTRKVDRGGTVRMQVSEQMSEAHNRCPLSSTCELDHRLVAALRNGGSCIAPVGFMPRQPETLGGRHGQDGSDSLPEDQQVHHLPSRRLCQLDPAPPSSSQDLPLQGFP